MSFKSKIECDACGCCNELEVDANHPSDAEIWLESYDGYWLFDDNYHYCPDHAAQAADELGVDY